VAAAASSAVRYEPIDASRSAASIVDRKRAWRKPPSVLSRLVYPDSYAAVSRSAARAVVIASVRSATSPVRPKRRCCASARIIRNARLSAQSLHSRIA
jgi:hypothetical protein